MSEVTYMQTDALPVPEIPEQKRRAFSDSKNHNKIRKKLFSDEGDAQRTDGSIMEMLDGWQKEVLDKFGTLWDWDFEKDSPKKSPLRWAYIQDTTTDSEP